jgi:hypothetical protein
LNQRLEAVSWALFLIMVGALWLAPQGALPGYSWLLGAGIIMLGLNGVRLIAGIKVSGFTVTVGILAIAAAISDIFGSKIPIVPVLLILVGLWVFVRAILAKGRGGEEGGEPKREA